MGFAAGFRRRIMRCRGAFAQFTRLACRSHERASMTTPVMPGAKCAGSAWFLAPLVKSAARTRLPPGAPRDAPPRNYRVGECDDTSLQLRGSRPVLGIAAPSNKSTDFCTTGRAEAIVGGGRGDALLPGQQRIDAHAGVGARKDRASMGGSRRDSERNQTKRLVRSAVTTASFAWSLRHPWRRRTRPRMYKWIG